MYERAHNKGPKGPGDFLVSEKIVLHLVKAEYMTAPMEISNREIVCGL